MPEPLELLIMQKAAGIETLSGEYRTELPSHPGAKPPEVPVCGQKFSVTLILKHGSPAIMPQCSPTSAGTLAVMPKCCSPASAGTLCCQATV